MTYALVTYDASVLAQSSLHCTQSEENFFSVGESRQARVIPVLLND